jgi:hypothetical protein
MHPVFLSLFAFRSCLWHCPFHQPMIVYKKATLLQSGQAKFQLVFSVLGELPQWRARVLNQTPNWSGQQIGLYNIYIYIWAGWTEPPQSVGRVGGERVRCNLQPPDMKPAELLAGIFNFFYIKSTAGCCVWMMRVEKGVGGAEGGCEVRRWKKKIVTSPQSNNRKIC